MAEKALAIAACGARGTGKTAFVKQYLDRSKPARLAVWDYKHDPALSALGTAYADLPSFIRALKASAFKVRYLPDHEKDLQEQFSVFCRACWTASRLTMFVDELPEVTKAGSAPKPWRKCVNVGREYTDPYGKPGWLSIIGAGQRAAECDKSFTSNCDLVHCGRLSHEDDASAMAKVLRCKASDLMTLPDLAWIEKRVGDIEPTRGTLTFSSKTKNSLKTPAATKLALKKTA